MCVHIARNQELQEIFPCGPFHSSVYVNDCFNLTVIDAPSRMDVRDVTDHTALVTWFLPVAEVDGVSISYGPSSHPTDRKVVELASTDTQYHLGGLEPDTQYDISLMARREERTSVPVYESFLTGYTNFM